jgi:hypothetical protein
VTSVCDPPADPGTKKVEKDGSELMLLGNDKWGVFLAPVFRSLTNITPQALWNVDVELGAEAGGELGAFVLGYRVSVLEALLSASLSACEKFVGASVKLFGDAIAVADTLQGSSLGFNPLVVEGDKVETPVDEEAECSKKFEQRNAKIGDLRTMAMTYKAVEKHFQKVGYTTDVCLRTSAQLNLERNSSGLKETPQAAKSFRVTS